MSPIIWAIFFIICCSSTSPLYDALPNINSGHHKILRREYILECDDYEARYGAPNLAGFQISSMRDLCLNYPHGLGAFCSGNAMQFREPRNPLYFQAWLHDGGGISHLCRRLCHCHDIAPELPIIEDQPTTNRGAATTTCSEDEEEEEEEEGPQPSNGVSAPRATESAECPNTDDTSSGTRYPRQFTCNAIFYGHPDSGDCAVAIRKLPDWGDTHNVIRQYFEIGDTSIADTPYSPQEIHLDDETSYSFRSRVRSPVIISNGACKIAVLLPEFPRQPTQRAYVGSEALINAANDLRAECVDGDGSGGKFDHLWFLDGNLLIPNIVMFEKDSLMDDWLTLKTTELIATSETSRSSHRSACSGSCMEPSDCDINSDCVCATNKPVPLSSTWGQHACMYVAGAALAHIQASTIHPHGHCRGRCLPEDSGAAGNATRIANSTNRIPPAASSISHSNLKGPPVSSSSLPSSSSHSPALPSPPYSSSNTSSTHPNSSINLPFPSGYPPKLTCPCNCTYVSASCCLSPLVWEAPSERVRMDPMAKNGSVCCDEESGRWRAKAGLGEEGCGAGGKGG